ncbi:esterase (plasmid) [Rhizobium rosettiformans]|uniref:Esterase n=1 Tax=Rhizobium rosettiformans TaxID=1368430 RepID=A0ABX7F1S9_9HYPH|nr:patatin-like phospholipase family protein [Rhizobium rosettiformans]QRF54477.1 esterase [Rhizobium rosettiformans]
MHFNHDVWLCFSGGNAIGAYHAGAYEALSENGIEPTAIAGASIGAITAALIAGNGAGERASKLKQFWSLAEQASLLPDAKQSRIAGGMQTLISGRPSLFHPRIDWSMFGMPSRASLFDPAPMRRELQALIDFDRLNSGAIRVVVTAVDVETGELRSFDTLREQLTVDHLMASTAFPVFFPPVRLSERHYVDPGVVCNLPIEPLFTDMPAYPVTCFAFDAAIPHGPVPDGVDTALIRAQDILFSAQSRYALARIRQKLDSFASDSGSARSSIRHYTFRDEASMETGLKMIDFRSDSLKQRWAEGRRTVLSARTRE